MASTVSIGRPKCSSAWSYFRYDKKSDKSVCIVETNVTSICGKEIKGQYPTNLKKHLRICHSDEYKCFDAAEAERIKEKDKNNKDSTKLKQSILSVSSLGSKPYESNSRKH